MSEVTAIEHEAAASQTMHTLTINDRTFAVRYDGTVRTDTAQSLTGEERAVARANIAAAGKAEVLELSAFWDPTVPVTEALLSKFYSLHPYASLPAAVADLNNGTLGTGTAGQEDAHAAVVYQDVTGKTVITLLQDVILTEDLLPAASCVLNLNGCTVTCSGDVSVYFQASAGDCLVDGRVPGSKLYKTGDVQANKPVLRFACSSAVVLGGTVEAAIGTLTGSYYTLFASAATPLVLEGCTVHAGAASGTGHIAAVLAKNALTARNCEIQVQNQAMATALWMGDNPHRLILEHTGITACSAGQNAYGVLAYQQAACAEIRNCSITARTDGDSSAVARGVYLLVQELTAEDTAVQGFAAQGDVHGFSLIGSAPAAAWLSRCRVYTASGGAAGESLGIGCATVTTHLEETEVFADSAACADGGIGVEAYGVLTVKNCRVYGARQGILIQPGCAASVDGGVYEGTTHGGVFIANTAGQTYVQNAVIRAARYRGQFKGSAANYGQGYMMAAVYIGGGEGYSDISAYMDNCLIDGGSPVIFTDSGETPIGCEPIRFRGSSGEQNNKLYLSNCTLQGAGKLFFANDTHTLYLGFGNTVGVQTNLPSRINGTACAGMVFIGHGQTNSGSMA